VNKGNILIVDDEPGVRGMLHDLLEDEDYNVTAVGSTREALQVVDQTDFDVALVDIMLPPDTGLVLIRNLRLRKPNIVPIVITGHSNAELANLAFKEHAFDYISKPVERTRLLNAVAKAIKSKASTTGEPSGTSPNQRLEKMRTLARCSVFDKLPDKTLHELADIFKVQQFTAGQMIYLQDAPGDTVYVVQEGTIALLRGSEELKPRVTIANVGVSGMLGAEALFKPGVYHEATQCQTDTTVMAISGSELRFILSKDPKTYTAVMEGIGTLLAGKLSASYRLLMEKRG